MIKPTVQIGNPIIRKKSAKITNFSNPKVKTTILDLTDSMRKHDLVGMAAPQIGIASQIFVTELRKTKIRKSLKELDGLRVYINPKILSYSKDQSVMYEGCGSLVNAQLFGEVKRPKKVKVKAWDENGNEFILEAKGLLAKVIQHEYDHLQGIVCIDKFMNIKKIMERGEYIRSLNQK